MTSVGLISFGAGIVVFARELLYSSPRLRIDEYGVQDRNLGVGIIPWSEITDVYVKELRISKSFTAEVICLAVSHPEMWIRHDSVLARSTTKHNLAFGLTEVTLSVAGLDVSADQVCALIRKFMGNPRRTNA